MGSIRAALRHMQTAIDHYLQKVKSKEMVVFAVLLFISLLLFSFTEYQQKTKTIGHPLFDI